MSFASKEVARVYNTRYVNAWRARHRAAGLCTRCTKPARPGKALCAHHAEWTRNYEGKTRKKRVRKKKP